MIIVRIVHCSSNNTALIQKGHCSSKPSTLARIPIPNQKITWYYCYLNSRFKECVHKILKQVLYINKVYNYICQQFQPQWLRLCQLSAFDVQSYSPLLSSCKFRTCTHCLWWGCNSMSNLQRWYEYCAWNTNNGTTEMFPKRKLKSRGDSGRSAQRK